MKRMANPNAMSRSSSIIKTKTVANIILYVV